MRLQTHGPHYRFDYVAWVNAVADKCIETYPDFKFTAYQWGVTPGVMAKFFRYEPVSLPTMLQIEFGSGVMMITFVVKID